MKKLILILLSLFGFSCDKNNKTDYIIDSIVETTPLIKPDMYLVFDKEYCDSLREKRYSKLKSTAEEAKLIKNKKYAFEQFVFDIQLVINDVEIDRMRVIEQTLLNELEYAKAKKIY